jgi:hypothetical protein
LVRVIDVGADHVIRLTRVPCIGECVSYRVAGARPSVHRVKVETVEHYEREGDTVTAIDAAITGCRI